MNSQEINNNVLGAVQILIDKSMTNLVGGETVICTIIDDTERQLGKYRVSPNEVVVYDAYSENTEYLEGEQVLVLIPDKSSDKRTIIRKYISKNTLEPLHYVSPAKQFIVQSELYNSDNKTFDINLNDATQKESILSNGEITIDAFDTCYIQTRFLCNVTENVTSGNYGLKFALTEKNPIDINKVHYAEVILDSSEMMGNPYRFTAPFMQEKIGYWQDLPEGMYTWSLILYQNNNFKKEDGTFITGASVTVSDIKIQIGYDVIAIPNKTVKLFHSGTNFYDNPSTNKTVSLAWYKKSNDNEYVGFGEDNTQYWSETIDEAKQCGTIIDIHSDEDTHTLTLILDTNQRVPLIADDGKQFEEYSIGKLITYTITKDEDEENLIYTPTLIEGKNVYFIDWQQDNSRGNLVSGLGEQPSHTTYNCICQSTLEKTRVNAVLWENGFAYPAEKILEFKNEGERTVNLNLTGVTMKIKHGANSKEAYTKYDGTSNQLIESTEAYINRTLEFNWDTDLPENTISPEFWNGAQITWYIPANGTMLMPDNNVITPQDDYYTITNQIEWTNNSLSGHTVNYRIKDYYSPQLTNNTIKCQVTITQEIEGQWFIQTLTGEITIGFGLFGTSGTDYTIVVTSPRVAMVDSNPYTLKFYVINVDGSIYNLQQDPKVTLLNSSSTLTPTLDNGVWQVTLNELQHYTVFNIRATVPYNETNVQIETMFPVTMVTDFQSEFASNPLQSCQIIAPQTILYNSAGTSPIYMTEPVLQWKIIWNGESLQSLTWLIGYYDIKKMQIHLPDQSSDYDSIKQGLPQLTSTGKFMVPELFVPSSEFKLCIVGRTQQSTLFIIPMVISQNKYESPLLNEWNSAMQIDEQNNYILSSMIGAGRKNSDNTFSGIIMGEKATLDSESNNFEEYETGLFGFNHGAQSYGFNIDGTAFIGTTGSGQIKFDGNQGYIASPDVTIDGNGNIQMPLTGGSIFDLRQGNLWLQQSDNDQFKFVGDEFNIQMYRKIKQTYVHQDVLSYGKNFMYAVMEGRSGYFRWKIDEQDYHSEFSSDKENPSKSFLFLWPEGATVITIEASEGGDQVSPLLEIEEEQQAFTINRNEFYVGNQSEHIHFKVNADETSQMDLSLSDLRIQTADGAIAMSIGKNDGLVVSTPINKAASVFSIAADPTKGNTTVIALQTEQALYQVDGEQITKPVQYRILQVKEGYIGYGNIGLYDESGNRLSAITIKRKDGSLKGESPQIVSPIGLEKAGYYTVYYTETNTLLSESNLESVEIDSLKVGYVKSGNTGLEVTSEVNTHNFTIQATTSIFAGSKLELSQQGYLFLSSKQSNTTQGGLILGNDPYGPEYALQIGTFKVKWDGTVEGIQQEKME